MNILLYNVQHFIGKLAIVRSDNDTCPDIYDNHTCVITVFQPTNLLVQIIQS